MSAVLYVISLAISGLVVGALARLVLPGRQQLSILATIALGLVGSVIGGVVTAAVSDERSPVLGLILSVVCGAGLLWVADRQGWVRTKR